MKADCIFLTGATGFIGRNLARTLADRDLHVLVRPGSHVDSLSSCRNITFYTHDSTTQGLVNALERSKPDLVIHLATYFVAEHTSGDLEQLVMGNVLLGTQLLEAMSITGVRRMINTGTSWQHFEGDDCRPVNLYAATKQAFETLVNYYVDASQLSVITLKLFDTYGPGDSRPKLFNVLRAADPLKPLLMSQGNQLIDLVYIDDVIAAFLAAERHLLRRRSAIHESFGVSSGDPRPLREIVEMFLKLARSNVNIKWGARPHRKREVMRTWTGFTPVPGWKAEVALEEGLSWLLDIERGGTCPVNR
jgi:nucleoside-diphosphate-sugar epimerase